MKVHVQYGQVDIEVEMEPSEFLAVTKELITVMGETQQRTMDAYRKTLQEAMAARTTSVLMRGSGGGNPEA